MPASGTFMMSQKETEGEWVNIYKALSKHSINACHCYFYDVTERNFREEPS